MPKFASECSGKSSQRLKESEMSYKVLFEAAPLGILIYSKDGQVLGANRFLLDVLGSPSLEDTKRINLFTFKNLKISGISEFLAGALERTEPGQLESLYTSKWGKTAYVEVIAVPLLEDGSTCEKAIAIVQDVTAQKRTQGHLLKSEIRFRLLADKIPLGIAIVDYTDHIEYMNPMFTKIFGYPSKETQTLQFCLDKAIPDVASRNAVARLSRCQRDFEAGNADQDRIVISCSDGSSKNIRFRAFSLDEEKRVIICEDNSELVRSFEQCQRFRRKICRAPGKLV